jgi:predicted Zn-dependent peptidase
MPYRNSVSVGLWVRVGGRYEKHVLSGISHFVEHIVFKGTRTKSARKIKEAVEGVGGLLNAFTSEEATCFLVKIPKNHFSLALDVLMDMVTAPTLRPRDIDKERNVILEEIKMYKDVPSHYVQELISELLWPSHPLGWNLAGDEKSVRRIKQMQLRGHMKRYYHPHNMVLAVCGDIAHERVRKELQTYPMSRRSNSNTFKAFKSTSARARFCFLEKNIEQTHFVMGFRALSRKSEDKYAELVLDILLGSNMSSRLYEEVREKRGLAYEIRTHTSFFEDTGAFTVSAGVESQKTQQAIKVILSELKKMTRQLVGKKELDRAKQYAVGQMHLALEDTMEHMLWMGEKVLHQDKVPSRYEAELKIRTLSAKDIQRVAKSIFQNSNLQLALIGPIPEKIQNEIRQHYHF